MLINFWFFLGDFGKICLPHPYTTASSIFLVHIRRVCIMKISNFYPVFGKTNRIRPSATRLKVGQADFGCSGNADVS